MKTRALENRSFSRRALNVSTCIILMESIIVYIMQGLQSRFHRMIGGFEGTIETYDI